MLEPLNDLVDTILVWLAGLDPTLLAALTAVFTALETTALIGLVVPGDVIVLLAGSTTDSLGRFVLVVAAAAGGSFAGELGGYALGRAVGPGLRRTWFGRRIGEARWQRAEDFLTGAGARMLVAVRFVSVAHAITPVVAGMVGMPLKRFALWCGLGAVLWAITYTAIGAAAGAAYRQYGHIGLYTSLGITLAVIAVVFIRSRRRTPAA